MKKLLKVLKITGISLLILLGIAFALPLVFKKQIVAKVKKEINANLVAVVDFKNVDISLLRSFPKLSVRLEHVSVVGTNEFAADTLVAAKNIDASLNLLSLFKEEMTIYGVSLHQPRIHALVNESGKANWDIVKPDTSSTTDTKDSSTSHFSMKLNHYSIHDGYIFYDDAPSGMRAEISGLDHEGSGDFNEEVFTLSTKTASEGVYFSYEGIPYFNNFKTTIHSDILVDNANSKYSFKGGEFQINELAVKADGFFQLVNDSTYNMDISFNAPSTDFKSILSLIPGIYQKDFSEIKTTGQAAFKGFVKGVYSPVQMPAYDVDLHVKEGSFQYPSLPKPVKNIRFNLKAANVDGAPDNTVLNISNAHLEMGNEPFDFNLLYKNPETAQYIDAAAKGKLDLSQVTSFIKLPDTKLAGLVNIDAFAKGSMKNIESGNASFNAGGFLDIQNLFYSSKDFPQPVQNGRMKLAITNSGGAADNTSVVIDNGHVEVGSNPIDFSFRLSNPMTTALFSGTAKGKFILDNIKQFTTLDPGTTITGLLTADLQFAGSKVAIDKNDYEAINTTGNLTVENVNYVSNDYPGGIKVSQSTLLFNPRNVTLQNLQASYNGSSFSATGFLNNLLGYALKNETLKGSLDVSVDKMNLNDWMGTTTTSTTSTDTATTSPFVVPSNLDLSLHARAGKITYDKVDYNHVEGSLLVKEETVELKNIQTQALDGSIAFNGSYSTKTDKTNPDINLAYQVKDVDIQKAFQAYNTVQKLMPVGQFLSGKLSSQLNMKGKLKDNLMPDLTSLTGNGNMLLLEGVLQKFAPLEKIASTLGVTELNSVSLKDVKSYIEFSNGKVLVKPFNLNVKDIGMQIGGMHGFDQSLQYIVQMKLPRSYLGTQGNTLVNNLTARANSKGIPVKPSDIVNLTIKLGGLVSNPTIQTDLKEAAGDATKELKQQATDFAKQKVDTAKQTVKDSVNVVKKQVTEGLKDELKNQLLGNKDSSGGQSLDSTKKKATETMKNTFNKLLKKKN